MEGIELLAGNHIPAELPDIPVSFEVWNQMVLDSYAFRFTR